MPIRTSRVSETSRQFQGEMPGNLLAKWLNDQKRSDAMRRIQPILQLLNEVVRIEGEMRKNHGWTASVLHELREYQKQGGDILFAHGQRANIERLKTELNVKLRFYRGFLSLSRVDISGRAELNLSVTSKKIRPAEAGALNTIFSLSGQGLLNRVRQCQQCERWIFARFDHQLSCSEKCRIKHSRSSEKWKARRREKMKEYYYREKRENDRYKNMVAKGGK